MDKPYYRQGDKQKQNVSSHAGREYAQSAVVSLPQGAPA